MITCCVQTQSGRNITQRTWSKLPFLLPYIGRIHSQPRKKGEREVCEMLSSVWAHSDWPSAPEEDRKKIQLFKKSSKAIFLSAVILSLSKSAQELQWGFMPWKLKKNRGSHSKCHPIYILLCCCLEKGMEKYTVKLPLNVQYICQGLSTLVYCLNLNLFRFLSAHSSVDQFSVLSSRRYSLSTTFSTTLTAIIWTHLSFCCVYSIKVYHWYYITL